MVPSSKTIIDRKYPQLELKEVHEFLTSWGVTFVLCWRLVDNPRFGGDEAGSPGPTFHRSEASGSGTIITLYHLSQIISESGTSYHLPTRGPDETEAVNGPEREEKLLL